MAEFVFVNAECETINLKEECSVSDPDPKHWKNV